MKTNRILLPLVLWSALVLVLHGQGTQILTNTFTVVVVSRTVSNAPSNYVTAVTNDLKGLLGLVGIVSRTITNTAYVVAPPAAKIVVSPVAVTFIGQVGGVYPAPQTLTFTFPQSVTWGTADTSPWFDAAPIKGTGTSGSTKLTPHSNGMTAGSYTNQIIVNATGLPGVTVPVFLVLTNAVTVPPPIGAVTDAPSNLVALAVSPTAVKLTWDDASTNEVGFQIERSASPTGPWAHVLDAPVNATGATDSGLQPSTTYSYRVLSWN